MKLNKISMVLAAMAIVGCSSEDVRDFSANQAIEDSRLVQLDPNFVLAGVGDEGNITRTHWEKSGTSLVNKFLPIYSVTPAPGDYLHWDVDLSAQAVGLCWLGNGAVGTDVYTNYEFYHFGWLKNGEKNAKFECGNLSNGAFYDEITVNPTIEVGGDEAIETNFTVPAKANPLNYNSGIYKTDNKAIFGGQYIVYYPYNEDFKDAGTIPALAATEFSPAATAIGAPEVGNATFRYSAPVTIEGGAQASDFGLYNLSALVQLRVAGPKGVTIGKNIDQIVLYSAKKQLLKQANLAADQIAAGKKGTELYTSTEGTKTISAIFGTPVAVQATDATPTSAYITVLPTTVEDLVVLVHANDGTWATVKLGKTVFEAGSAKRVDIPVKAADFKSEYIAVDEPSLISARNEARTFIFGGGSTATVEIIGDITLDGTNADSYGPDTYDFQSDPADAKITYKGDAIIVPEDITLQTGTKIESDVRVLGKSCCTGTNGGTLDIYGGTLSNVTIVPTEAKVNNKTDYDNYNPWVIYSGDATIAAGKMFDVQAGNVVVNAAVQHKGDINIAEDVTLIVSGTGDLNFMGATVVNDGTIEVQKDGKFDMTDKNGNATANDGKRMTNNGKFIHNVDAGVGTAVQKMNQNGEYRCRVDDQIKLDDAYLQWTACSVIEMVNAGTTYDLGKGEGVSYKHNGKFIDIEVNTTGGCTFINPDPDNKEIHTGKLSVLQGGLAIDYTNTVGTTTGKRTLTVNGDMTVKATTSIWDSKKINIKQNLTVDGAGLWYAGVKNADGSLKTEAFTVTGDITVSGGAGNFDAGDVDALNITCANFKLEKGAIASFGNRTDGDSHNLTVSGKIDNPAGCTFDIIAANQVTGSVLAWVTCSELIAQGTFTGAKPRVE